MLGNQTAWHYEEGNVNMHRRDWKPVAQDQRENINLLGLPVYKQITVLIPITFLLLTT